MSAKWRHCCLGLNAISTAQASETVSFFYEYTAVIRHCKLYISILNMKFVLAYGRDVLSFYLLRLDIRCWTKLVAQYRYHLECYLTGLSSLVVSYFHVKFLWCEVSTVKFVNQQQHYKFIIEVFLYCTPWVTSTGAPKHDQKGCQCRSSQHTRT